MAALKLPVMELYLLLRKIHITCVAVTAFGFTLRGIWMLHGSALLEHRLTRTLPHINDTLLLGSAIGLAWLARLNPLDHGWLKAKLVALLAYILLGSIALRRGPSLPIRAGALVAALVALSYMVAVALTRNPWPLG